jgi:hypothetical protein
MVLEQWRPLFGDSDLLAIQYNQQEHIEDIDLWWWFPYNT